VLLAGFAPWSLLLPQAVGLAWRQRREEEGREAWFLALWAAAVFLFFSFAGSKLPGYLLPAFPPLALLVARTFVPRPGAALPSALLRTWWLDAGLALLVAVALAGLFLPGRIFAAASEGITGDVRLIGAVTLAVAGLGRPGIAAMCLGGWIVVAAPLFVCVSERIEDRYSVAPIARRFASRIPSDAGVVQYRGYSEGLPFYLKRRVILYRHVGELYEGYRRSKPVERDHWFITEKKDLARILAGERRVFVLTSRSDEPDLVGEFPALRRLDESARYALFATRPPGGSSPSSGAPSGDR
jgi:4-amino-4-deoxy-L-arabinose transferase-like glycosyltransferase